MQWPYVWYCPTRKATVVELDMERRVIKYEAGGLNQERHIPGVGWVLTEENWDA